LDGSVTDRPQAIELTKEKPLRLRYLLHGHADRYDPLNAKHVAQAFESWPWLAIKRFPKKHQAYELIPEPSK
jgi:hypothetical protein